MGISNLLRVGHVCALYIDLNTNRLAEPLASLGYSSPHTKYEKKRKKKKPFTRTTRPKTVSLHQLPACCGISISQFDCTKDRQHPLQNPSKNFSSFCEKAQTFMSRSRQTLNNHPTSAQLVKKAVFQVSKSMIFSVSGVPPKNTAPGVGCLDLIDDGFLA